MKDVESLVLRCDLASADCYPPIEMAYESLIDDLQSALVGRSIQGGQALMSQELQGWSSTKVVTYHDLPITDGPAKAVNMQRRLDVLGDHAKVLLTWYRTGRHPKPPKLPADGQYALAARTIARAAPQHVSGSQSLKRCARPHDWGDAARIARHFNVEDD